MTIFPSAIKSVFSGIAAENLQSVQALSRPWNLFRPISPPRALKPADGLQDMVEGEIIPRLLKAHPTPISEDGFAEPGDVLNGKSVEAFARTILSRNPDALGDFVEKLRARGVGSERLYADLLAPAAHLLADLWNEDTISYTEVTIGLSRLHQLVHDLGSSTAYNGESDPDARRCLFSPRAGEQQTFGFYIIEELFRWSGWRTWIETCATDAQMVADVRCHWFDLFCLSVSRSSDIQDVATTIEKVRRASRNRDLYVLVNGRPFIERPELVATVGANAVASTGREALCAADRGLRRLATA